MTAIIIAQFFGCCVVFHPPVDQGPVLKCHKHDGATVCRIVRGRSESPVDSPARLVGLPFSG